MRQRNLPKDFRGAETLEELIATHWATKPLPRPIRIAQILCIVAGISVAIGKSCTSENPNQTREIQQSSTSVK